MHRLLMILPLLVAVVACADAPPPLAGPQQGVRVSFPPGGLVNVIRIDALDTLPLRTAELVAPDGTLTEAASLEVDANPRTIGGQEALNDPWRSSVLSSNGNNPLPTGIVDPVVRSQNQVFLTASTADITLPDPVAYRRDWSNYKIRLGFAGPGHQLETRELPAPQPPPPPAGS
jgi:hypothetical protein